MKVLTTENIMILIPRIKDRTNWDIDDFNMLLERFGDDYYIEDGKFIKTEENKEMAALRNMEE